MNFFTTIGLWEAFRWKQAAALVGVLAGAAFQLRRELLRGLPQRAREAE